MVNQLWLIGVGNMSLDYAKVLDALNIDYAAVGRGARSAEEFEKKTNHAVLKGGLPAYLGTRPPVPKQAIVSVGVEQLKSVSMQLIQYGVKQLLVEKPAGLDLKEIGELNDVAHSLNASVYVAYNRRFYSSVQKAKEIILDDGGVTSFNFEFTEWSHEIEKLTKAAGVMEHWFLGNSTHVADLAFYLGGKPKELHSYTSGGLAWHPSASVFAGSGISERGALFSYQANWSAPGRWGIEILTKKHRLIFRPLEKLQIQNIGSVATNFVEIDDALDTQFKPGLYKQVACFIKGETQDLCTIEEQYQLLPFYNRMANYQL